MLPQYRSELKITAEMWRTALGLMRWGHFKKIAIADNAVLVVNKSSRCRMRPFLSFWAGVFAFAVQIYADFSGYTDIAPARRGSSGSI